MTMVDSSPAENQLGQGPQEGRRLGPQIVAGGALVLIGALWLFERLDIVDLSVTTVLALATLMVGVAIMILANRGSHGGLIVFGTVLALVASVTAIAPMEGFQGGVGERVFEVQSSNEIAANYDLAMGTLTVDLRDLTDLSGVIPVSASVGMGELIIRVPTGTPVEVSARVGAGQIEIFDRSIDGVGIEDTYRSPTFADDVDGLSLEIEVFTGRVEVSNG